MAKRFLLVMVLAVVFTPLEIVFLTGFTCNIAYAENGPEPPPETAEITLTTYYPAPYGDYEELSASKWLQLNRTGYDTGELRLAAIYPLATTTTLWNLHNRGPNSLTDDSGDGDKLYLTYYDGAVWSGPHMVVDTSGNVGIGTTNPQGALHITGPSAESSLKGVVLGMSTDITRDYASIELKGTSASLGGGFIDFGYPNDDYQGRIACYNIDNSMRFFTAATYRMMIDNNGNVGIGTTGPLGLLHVESSDGTDFVIDSTNGNVGIGTTSPDAKLHLGGTPGPTNGIKFPDGTVQTRGFDPADLDTVGWGNDSEGSVTFPNGLIWKWGKASVSVSGTTITFTTAFPNACFQAFVGLGSSDAEVRDTSAYELTASSFSIITNRDVAFTVRWFAIGR